MSTTSSRPALVSKLRTLAQAGLFLALLAPGCGPVPVEAADELELDTVQQKISTTLHTSVVPSQLSITANQESSSGTTEWFGLKYCNGLGTSFCLLQGISGGETKTCTPALGFSGETCSTDRIEVSFVNTTATDGLRVTTLGATVNGTAYSLTEFNNTTIRKLDCSGCTSSDKNCNACWIDTDDHNSCKKMLVSMDTNNSTICGEYTGE